MNTSPSQIRPQLLLADDDGLVLATLGTGLRNAGFDVIECRDGEEALEKCANALPDLAIVDIGMPGISGLEVADSLRMKKVPVLFLTAMADDETVQSAIDKGALGYIVKPTDPLRLVPAVKSALSRAAEMRSLAEESARMAASLETGRLVNVAVGIIMERFRLGREESFNLMRTRARNERRKIALVAQEITSSAEALNRLGSLEGTARQM